MSKSITITRKSFWLLTLGCFWAFLLTLNIAHQVAAKESNGDDVYRYLKAFTDVMALVQKNYVEQVQVDGLVEGAINGMLLTLDPHSGYLNADVFKELQVETKGKFGGLGIEITVKDGLLTVVAPIEDTPAYRAGVKAGDQIIKIDGEFTKNLSLIDAVKKMRGPKGTSVTLHVHRPPNRDLIPITVHRDVIKVQSVRYRMLEDGVVYIRLAQFQEGSAKEFISAMSNLAEKVPGGTINGLVLDLRNNPGGLLTQAIRVADLFIKEGVVVYTDGRLESQKQKYFARNDGNEPEYPIVVLVNEGSASASEIVSGALQDHGRAVVLGMPTFGKGSVQTILPMDNGGALRLTTALYYTKSGRAIQAHGVKPDVRVGAKRYTEDSEAESSTQSFFPQRESDLPGALKDPKSEGEKQEQIVPLELPEDSLRIGSRDAITAKLSDLLEADPQLDEALRLLKTWKVFQSYPGVRANAVESKTTDHSSSPTNG